MWVCIIDTFTYVFISYQVALSTESLEADHLYPRIFVSIYPHIPRDWALIQS